MGQIGNPQRVIEVTPVVIPVPSRPAPMEEPMVIPDRIPVEVPA